MSWCDVGLFVAKRVDIVPMDSGRSKAGISCSTVVRFTRAGDTVEGCGMRVSV